MINGHSRLDGNGNGHGHEDLRHPRIVSLPEDRLPPSSLEAERGVLGAVLLDNDTLHDVVPLLKVEDFYRDSHQVLYRAIRDLYDEGRPVDPIILADELRRRQEYDRIGGDDTLVEILGCVPHAANAKYHAQIVRQKAIVRELIQGAHETLREAYACEQTAEELVASAERRVFALAEADSAGETQPVAVHLASAMDRISRRDQGEVVGVPTGFADLDEMTDGLPDGALITVGARPGIGKTSVALNIAEHAVYRGGVPVLFVSLEMSGQELAERLLVSHSRVDGHRVRTGSYLSNRDRASLSRAHDAAKAGRLWIDDSPFRSVVQIAANARRHRLRHGIGLLVIDYLQLIEPDADDRKRPRHEQVARVSRRLKALAKELSIPVLALCQLNRQPEARDDRRPRMADLRESGSVEQDSDMVLLLHRPDAYDPDDRPREADIIVAKNRNGPTGTVRLTYRKEIARFENYAHPGEVDDWDEQYGG